MIPNFEEVKVQLAELAKIVNEFKSEQVQLKIVESVLQSLVLSRNNGPPLNNEQATDKAPKRRKSRRGSGAKADAGDEGGKPAKVKSNGRSPKQSIETLMAQGYFKQRRTIGVVQEQIRNNYATTLTLAAIQNALNRMLKGHKLAREKNAENQFEYYAT